MMIPKSWFRQTFNDIYRANQRITQLLMIGQELEARCKRVEADNLRLYKLISDWTSITAQEVEEYLGEGQSEVI